TDYYYDVTAYNSYGESAQSGWVKATTLACPQAPGNDDFNNSTQINSMPYNTNQDITGATTAGDDPTLSCIGGQGYASVWFAFTPSTNGALSANTTGSGYDTVLGVWKGSRGALSNVACNDDSGGNVTSMVSAALTGGTTYYIEVAAYSSGFAPNGKHGRILGPVSSNLQLAATFTAGGTNLLANPDFELDSNRDGKPDSWTTSPKFTRSSAVVQSGGYAGRFMATDNSGVTINQTVKSLRAGKTYNFSGWVNIPSTTDAFTFKLQVKWRNTAGTVLRTDTIATFTRSTSGWVQSTANLVAPTGTANAQVLMVASSLKATIYVDNFAFGQ
ncbi:MAG: carbohydrate binding domain-containing protein, partial [Anaerolineae bacterium]